MDQGDAVPARIVRSARRVARAIERHLAAVGLHLARQHVHQRALPCSVLTEEREYLTRTHREIDSVEREGRPIALRDPVDLQPLRHWPTRYLSIGGWVSSFISGVSIDSGVTRTTPVSMRFSTGLPLRWSTIVFTPR